jgi:hypothetical protein
MYCSRRELFLQHNKQAYRREWRRVLGAIRVSLGFKLQTSISCLRLSFSNRAIELDAAWRDLQRALMSLTFSSHLLNCQFSKKLAGEAEGIPSELSH